MAIQPHANGGPNLAFSGHSRRALGVIRCTCDIAGRVEAIPGRTIPVKASEDLDREQAGDVEPFRDGRPVPPAATDRGGHPGGGGLWPASRSAAGWWEGRAATR